MTDRLEATEYGGVEGLVQPPPHSLTAAERARRDRWQDSLNPVYDDTLLEPNTDGHQSV